jgi:hypothetical protein
MKRSLLVGSVLFAKFCLAQQAAECPLNMISAGISVRDHGQSVSIIERSVRIEFSDTSGKDIVAMKFGAVLFNKLDESYDTETGYIDDKLLKWDTNRAKDGKEQKPRLSFWNIYKDTADRADAWIEKVKLSDGTIWQDDGSKRCNVGVPSMNIPKGGLATELRIIDEKEAKAAGTGSESVWTPIDTESMDALTDLRNELSQVQQQIGEAQREDAQFKGGLIKTQIQRRIAALQNLEASLNKEVSDVEGGAVLNHANLDKVRRFEAQMRQSRKDLVEAQAEDRKYAGGLIKAEIEEWIAVIEDTLALLNQQRLALKFTITDPSSSQSVKGGSLSITSAPNGADLEVDGNFVGNLPAKIQLTPGKHDIKISKAGYHSWTRTLTVLEGSTVELNATLEPSRAR